MPERLCKMGGYDKSGRRLRSGDNLGRGCGFREFKCDLLAVSCYWILPDAPVAVV